MMLDEINISCAVRYKTLHYMVTNKYTISISVAIVLIYTQVFSILH